MNFPILHIRWSEEGRGKKFSIPILARLTSYAILDFHVVYFRLMNEKKNQLNATKYRKIRFISFLYTKPIHCR